MSRSTLVVIHSVVDDRKTTCLSPATGVALLEIFEGQERLVLASITPLKNGVLRRYRAVCRDAVPYDLDQYHEVYSVDRQFLAHIEKVSHVEHVEAQRDNATKTTVWTTDHGVLFGESEDSRPTSIGGHRRLNPAEPVWVDPALMCSCNVCLHTRFPANSN